MRRFRTIHLPIGLAVVGLGVAVLGVWQLWGSSIGPDAGQTISMSSMGPIVEVTVGAVLCAVALLLTIIRPRERAHTAAVATAGQAPLIVSREGDEVTFIWGDAGRRARSRGTSRATADTV